MTRLIFIFIFAISTPFFQGCTTTGGATLSIDAQRVIAPQSMPDEIADMLSALGYDWIPVADPNVLHGVKVGKQDGEYRMLFQHLTDRKVRIDVRIRRFDDFTRLNLYEIDSRTLSPSSRTLLQRLRERVVLEFGDANVKFTE